MQRCFAIDVETCPSCGGRMKLKALVTRPQKVERFLRWLGEPTDAPSLSPARDPPSYKSRVVRRRSLAAHPQRQLFAAYAEPFVAESFAE